ncbi:radical SAM/SPASM domain-containing protein [Helicobacter sp. 13S00477-4]|uniref:radical SAM/SPASM domain-containing protein n=1 Tax=Helicobacter sp. 13S00477-4 TaxID=1905759 RepID=UPI000BC964D1|nr:radical SAM/SPASM domain-containing protein [Helicobacter sp. 13S00477-4]PAF52579.1 hypothetical protein BKH44_02045 [Helicobacter sp. 13S00477-4]
MFKFKKIYIELSDICGLHCSFCPNPKNIRKVMPINLFQKACEQSVGLCEYIALHILGDPCKLDDLKDYLMIAQNYGLKVDLVTSGFYLYQDNFDLLLDPPIHQLSISLNAGFDVFNPQKKYYLQTIFELCHYKILKDTSGFINLRIQDSTLDDLSGMKELILEEFNVFDRTQQKRFRLGKKVFLNITKTFQWAKINPQKTPSFSKYCYGLISQVGILADGTVVPCCIDVSGKINLGNLNSQDLIDILTSKRASNIREGFLAHKAVEELCAHCQYPAKRG